MAQDAIVQVKVNNALNPCLWLCGLIVIPALIFAYLTTGAVQIAALILAFIPVTLTAAGYIFLLLFDRDKLQSESYQLRKMALELIEEKGSDIPVSMASVEVISNPELPATNPSRQKRLKP